MYRASEIKLFAILSWVANLSAFLGLIMTASYYIFRFQEIHLTAGIIAIVFSGFFKIQITMYKVTILEKRMLHMVEPSLQHFKVASKRETIDLVIYFVLFWTTLIGLTFAFLAPPG